MISDHNLILSARLNGCDNSRNPCDFRGIYAGFIFQNETEPCGTMCHIYDIFIPAKFFYKFSGGNFIVNSHMSYLLLQFLFFVFLHPVAL